MTDYPWGRHVRVNIDQAWVEGNFSRHFDGYNKICVCVVMPDGSCVPFDPESTPWHLVKEGENAVGDTTTGKVWSVERSNGGRAVTDPEVTIHYSVQRKNSLGQWFTVKIISSEDDALETAKKLGRNVRVRKTTDEVLKLPLPDEVTITFKVGRKFETKGADGKYIYRLTTDKCSGVYWCYEEELRAMADG